MIRTRNSIRHKWVNVRFIETGIVSITVYIVTAQFEINLLIYVAYQNRQAIPGPEVINLSSFSNSK